jgi:hypothetical protein
VPPRKRKFIIAEHPITRSMLGRTLDAKTRANVDVPALDAPIKILANRRERMVGSAWRTLADQPVENA